MSPSDFLTLLWDERTTAIMRSNDRSRAAAGMEAAVRGGFRVIEFTMTTPDVLELIADFSQRDRLAVGAGTVLTAQEARSAVEAGARFLVSPVVDEEVISAANDLGVAIMPGTHTPTEMVRAHRAGAPLQKLFPAAATGAAHVRSILGPLPFLRIVPTNGVTVDNVADYLAAGAYACGFVGSLFDPEDMAAERWGRIEERARAIRQAALVPGRQERPQA